MCVSVCVRQHYGHAQKKLEDEGCRRPPARPKNKGPRFLREHRGTPSTWDGGL